MPRPSKPRRVKIGSADLRESMIRVAIVAGSNPIREARRARRVGAHAIEARVDLWSEHDPGRLALLLRRVRRAARLPVVLTIRTKGSGGGWESKGRGEHRRLAMYQTLLREADAVDIEFNTRGRNRIARAARRARRPLILSHHESRRSLGARAMESLATRMRRAGADVVKIAPYCRSREDLVEALTFLGRTPNRPVAVAPMGPWGPVGRAIAPLFGNAVEYVPVGKPVAEGQASAGALDAARRAIGLDRMLRRRR